MLINCIFTFCSLLLKTHPILKLFFWTTYLFWIYTVWTVRYNLDSIKSFRKTLFTLKNFKFVLVTLNIIGKSICGNTLRSQCCVFSRYCVRRSILTFKLTTCLRLHSTYHTAKCKWDFTWIFRSFELHILNRYHEKLSEVGYKYTVLGYLWYFLWDFFKY